MKTAISIPDATFAAADTLAKRLGISRSELYSTAVAEFVERRHAAGVSERLNAVYDVAAEACRLETVMETVTEAALDRTRW